MCYSAQILADYRQYVRLFGATIDMREFVDLFWRRRTEASIKLPRAVEDAFDEPVLDAERAIKDWVVDRRDAQAMRLQGELFAQRERLVTAERALQFKVTRAAAEHQRVARAKIEALHEKLADLRRRQWKPDDSRIFPGTWAPVIVMEGGQRVVKLMRYQCRPAGTSAFHDSKFAGTYNARRDNLQGKFWKPLFGSTHAVMVVESFFEHVERTGSDGSKQNVVLQFTPQSGELMLVPCLWSRWSAPGEPDLMSFAAITDEPPAEVAAAGHDRCVVAIKPENLDAWLEPQQRSVVELQAILDDRPVPGFEWKLAA